MPLVYNQLVPANAAQPGYNEAKELARQTLALYGQVAGMGVGIAGGSCRAALAVAAAPAFPALPAIIGFAPPLPSFLPQPITGAVLPYGVAFGNSQLAAGGLVLGPVGAHAERAALTAAAGIPLYTLPGGGNNAVMFVELTPCANCQAWLNGGAAAWSILIMG